MQDGEEARFTWQEKLPYFHGRLRGCALSRGANEPSGSRTTRNRLEKKLETSRASSSPSMTCEAHQTRRA
ncbi:hypothetical protein HanIR_Chr16g0834381 [Helianthus annuus]|nr:hypothetical protein HanIR_Chr16g0834381 [Helianthus annuus]